MKGLHEFIDGPTESIKDSIELGGEGVDEAHDVDAVIDVMDAAFSGNVPRTRRGRDIAVVLGTSGAKPVVRSKTSTGAKTQRHLRTKPLNRHVNSREVFGLAEDIVWATEEDNEELHREFDNPTVRLGSPVLGSSATEFPSSQPDSDVYEIPDDPMPHSPVPARHKSTRNAPALRSRTNKVGKSAGKVPSSKNVTRVSSIQEETAALDRHDAPLSLGEQDRTPSENQKVVKIQIHSVSPLRTLKVDSHHVRNMQESTTPDSGTIGPARTDLGKMCLELLGHLKDRLDKVPMAVDLSTQSRFLDERADVLNEALTSVEEMVTSVCDTAQVTRDESFRTALSEDLSSCILPMVVLVLRSSFVIGSTEDHDEDSLRLPAIGVFTWSTVQYLLWITGWMARLYSLQGKLQPPPAQQATGQGGPTLSRSHDKFKTMLGKWREHLRSVVDDFNEQVDRDRDRKMKKEKDEAIKKAKQELEMREREQSDRQFQLCVLSVQRVLSQPGPLAEMWYKDTQNPERLTLPASQVHNSRITSNGGRARAGTQGLDRRSATLPRSSSSLSIQPPAPLQRQRAPPSPELGSLPWTEDEIDWFLKELQRPDRNPYYLSECTETLDRTRDELLRMEEWLKRTGRYRPSLH
jgi:hypothetical protein